MKTFAKSFLGLSVLLLLFGYLLIGFNFDINLYDEGICAYLSMRVADGHVPYRDFWTVYGPAQFYAIALAFKLFGASLLVERIWTVTGIFLLSWSVFLVLKRFVSNLAAIAAGIFTLIWMGQLSIYGYPVPWALFFSMISAWFLFEFIRQKNVWRIFYCGIFNGVTVLFRHDIAYYNFIAEVCTLLWLFSRNPSEREGRVTGKPAFTLLATLKFYAAGMAAIVLPVALYFVSVVPLKDLFFDFITCPLTITPKVSYLPYPGIFSHFTDISANKLPASAYVVALLQNFNFYFPIVTGLLVVFVWVSKALKKEIRWDNIKIWGELYFVLLGVLYFNQVVVRSDMTHLFPVMVVSSILFFLLFEELKVHNRAWRLFQAGLILALILLPIRQKLYMVNLSGHLKEYMFEFNLEGGRGIFVDKLGEYHEKAIQYIQKVVPEDERIYVGQSRHDRIVTTDMMFYFLANRHSVTKYHGWLITTQAVQEEIIKGIEHYRVNYIVIRDDRVIIVEPNETAKSSGVFLLDEYIVKNFTLDQQFDNYFILKRKRPV